MLETGLLLEDFEIQYAKDQNKTWHRSKDKKGGRNPFTAYMMNKKWTLEEEFNKHMLRYQQVTGSSIYSSKLYFDIPGRVGGH